jgi:hypothetical protein
LAAVGAVAVLMGTGAVLEHDRTGFQLTMPLTVPHHHWSSHAWEGTMRRTILAAIATAIVLAGVAFTLRSLGNGTQTPNPAGIVGGFPTADTTGLPAGWTPKTTVPSLTVTTAGATITDTRVTGQVLIEAPDVTLDRVEILDGSLTNYYESTCQGGLTIRNSYIHNTSVPATGPAESDPTVQVGSYTADNVKMENITEGFRVGGDGDGCGSVSIANSWVHVSVPTGCANSTWHGDGLQGYDGSEVIVRNDFLWLDQSSACGGTAAFFYPKNQGNTSVDIDGLIVKGGGYSFRDGMPGPVKNLYAVDQSWVYGPVDVDCTQPTVWDAHVATLADNGQPVPGDAIQCRGDGS